MIRRFLAGWLAVLLACLGGALAQAATPSLQLDVRLDPSTRLLKAQIALPVSAGDFEFPLHESLTITAARLGAQALVISERGRVAGLRHWRITGIKQGGTLVLDYQGNLPALEQNRDHRGVLGWLPPMSSPAGSFLPASGYWYPQPGGLFSYRLRLEVTGNQRALVPGQLMEERPPEAGDPAATYRASFVFSEPIDGIDLMAGPWVVRERQGKTTDGRPLRLRTYFTAELDAMPGLAEAYLDDSARYLDRYSRLIGDYPFTEFSVVAAPLPTGFGMPTLTYLGADVLRLPFIRATSLGHEVLHNWWGNGVYTDYGKGNWNEGLTTFMADYAYKEEASGEAGRDMRVGWLRDLAAIAPGDAQPLAAFRSRTHGAAAAIGYGKSAMLFFMLRDEIGKVAFDAGIRRFWQENRFRTAGWKKLQAAFEAAAGQPLGAFFRQWLNERDDPALRLRSATLNQASGQDVLQLQIEQGSTRHRLLVPVEIDFGDRTEVHRVRLEQSVQQVSLNLAARPRAVRLDPEFRVWQRLEAARLPPILRQWILAERPALAIASGGDAFPVAARALGKRLFERPATEIEVTAIAGRDQPVLLIGLATEIDATLVKLGLPGRPANLAGRGEAQVWTVPGTARLPPLAVVSVSRVEDVKALQRPLPHYGAQSWLILEAGKVIERGSWPVMPEVIPVVTQN